MTRDRLERYAYVGYIVATVGSVGYLLMHILGVL